MEKLDVYAAVKNAVEEERARCLAWARALRRGDLPDARSLCQAIEDGDLYIDESDE